jgi:hypothetical protein
MPALVSSIVTPAWTSASSVARMSCAEAPTSSTSPPVIAAAQA